MMDADRLDRLLLQELNRRGQTAQLRARKIFPTSDSTPPQSAERLCLNFASNDYLGLRRDQRLSAAAAAAIHQYGTGAGASPLVCGYTRLHASAERAIARWKGAESAILLPSGYQTSHAIIQTLAAVHTWHRPGVRFLIDKLAHASLIDAIVGSGAPYRVFPHNHIPKLQRLLEASPSDQLQVVVTESIFSMDGDAADLPALADLKRRFGFTLILDEAHASGVYGPGGSGYAAECGLGNIVDISIVTLSKALGGVGGAACGSRTFCDALANWGRAYIYSTAVPPSVPAVALEALKILAEEPQRQQRVRELARRVRQELKMRRLRIPEGDSPIIPIILGGEREAIEAADRLRERGILVVAIRPPTVARGTSRLRITLSSAHTDDQVAYLVEQLGTLAVP